MVAIVQIGDRIQRFLKRRRCPVFFGRRTLRGLQAVRSDEHGAMLIEMAIVLPVFFMLLFGIFNISMALFGRGNALCAADMAARYAALHSPAAVVPATTASIKSYVNGYLYAAPVSGTQINISYYNGNDVVGGTVTVVVTVTYSTGIPFYGINNVTVQGSAVRLITR